VMHSPLAQFPADVNVIQNFLGHSRLLFQVAIVPLAIHVIANEPADGGAATTSPGKCCRAPTRAATTVDASP